MDAQVIDFIFSVAILIMSVVIHEVSHGFVADSMGDPTARYQGRLTLNPVKHLDPFGSVIIPALTYFMGGFIFGWAKPVPYNPYNLKNQKWGPATVAGAGPFSNLLVAVIFGLVVRFGIIFGLPSAFIQTSLLVVFINLILMVFNLVPLPPLDGSKLLFALLPIRFYYIQRFLEQYGFFLIIVFILFFWDLILPLVFLIFKLITGISFTGFYINL